MENEKTTCILFKTLFDAALRLIEEHKEDVALDVLITYGKYAFGYTDGIETNSLMSELLVKQNVPSLNAATNRYNAAVENGKKGKEFGRLGGRPRKGETKEQARERRNTPEKPQSKPQNQEDVKTPEKPLTVSVSDSVSKSISYSNSNTVSITEDNLQEKEMKKEKEKPSQVVVDSGKTEVKRDLMKLEDVYQLPDMEKRLEMQYQYVLKDLAALRRKRYDFSENCYLQETIDWVEATDDYPVLTNCMLGWYDGGREKLAGMVRGLEPKVTKDIMVYLVLSCIAYDAQDEENRYSAVYSA